MFNKHSMSRYKNEFVDNYNIVIPFLAKWQVLCTFKALQEIDVKVKAAQNGSSLIPDGVELNRLTLEQFYNLYEALDFKWIPPLDYKWILPVCYNCSLVCS